MQDESGKYVKPYKKFKIFFWICISHYKSKPSLKAARALSDQARTPARGYICRSVQKADPI